MALLRIGQRQVELLEARLAAGLPLGQRLELGVDLGELVVESAQALRRGLGLLGQPQQLDVQLVGAGLRLGRLAPALRELRRCAGVGRVGAHLHGARLVGDQRLRAARGVEVLDLLRAREHAGLLGVGGIEGDRKG